jgi:molybdenum cofactor cytidylyltransferase
MGFPKALLKIGDESFARCIARKARQAGITAILLITGPDHDAIAAELGPDIVCVRNEDFLRGQISSLQKGIRSLAAEADAVMVWPVDQPLITADTVQRLVQSFQREEHALTVPVYRGRKGHPVIYRKQVMQSALSLDSWQTGKELQSMYSNDRMLVDVEDPAILIDIDTPEEYSKYITE